MDLKALSDAELGEHLDAVLAERERRAALQRIPGEIATLRQQYVDGGGDLADLDTIPA